MDISFPNTDLRETLIDLLKMKKLEVVFTKLSGEERIMNCTLIPELLPVESETTTPRKDSEKVIRCFDLDIKEFRSFRIHTIKSVKVLYDYN